MKQLLCKSIVWMPRVLGLLFAAFISIFALDVFSEGYSFWMTVGALLRHLIPTFLVIVVVVLSWRWSWIGAILFGALGIFYLFLTAGRFPVGVYFVIAGPLFVMSFLYTVNWLLRVELRSE